MTLPASGQISMSQIETELFHGGQQPNPPGSNPSRYFNLDSNYVRNLASSVTNPTSPAGPVQLGVGGKAINTSLSQISMSNLHGKENLAITGVIQNPLNFYYRFERFVPTGEGGGYYEYVNRRGIPLQYHESAYYSKDVWAMTSDSPSATQNPSNVYPGSTFPMTKNGQGSGSATFTSYASVPQLLHITMVFFIGCSCPTKFGIMKNATAGTTSVGGTAVTAYTIGISGRGANWSDQTVGTSLDPTAGSAYQSYWDPTTTLQSNGFTQRLYITLVVNDTVYPGQTVGYYGQCINLPGATDYQVDYNGLYTANVEQWGWPLG